MTLYYTKNTNVLYKHTDFDTKKGINTFGFNHLKIGVIRI